MYPITEKNVRLILRRTLTLKSLGSGSCFHPPPRFFPNNSENTKDIFLKLYDFSPILTENVAKSKL